MPKPPPIMNYLPVLSKPDFVRRYKLGEFGNHSPTWDTLEEFKLSDYRGLLHLRNRYKPGGKGLYNLLPYVVEKYWSAMADPSEFYCSGMAPHARGTIQGEVMETERGLYLHYNLERLPMREGFQKSQLDAYSIIAVQLLRTYLCPNSYEWLQTLLCRYPGHVIEFSSFSIPWGTLPHFNTTFWEVRNY